MRRWAVPLAILLIAGACHSRKDENVEDMPPARGAGMLDPREEPDPQKRIDEIARKIERGEMAKVEFGFDLSEIRHESYPTLDAILQVLLDNPNFKLIITAHTCSIGTHEYNLKLSRRRAHAVKEYLVKKGLPPPSVRYYGMGDTMPIADNSTEEGREKNRRVEFRVTDKEWNSVW